MSTAKKPLRVSAQLRIETTDKVFGMGHVQLMECIQRTGSLNGACAETGISYSKAWKILAHAGDELGFPLLTGKIGGKGGGGSVLTQEGIVFMEQYKAFCTEARAELEIIFAKYFPAE